MKFSAPLIISRRTTPCPTVSPALQPDQLDVQGRETKRKFPVLSMNGISAALAILLLSTNFLLAEWQTDRGVTVWVNAPNSKRTFSWTGKVDADGKATGPGTISFLVNGQRSASYTGVMEGGEMNGKVVAIYHRAQKRYEGEISKWSENGRGTMVDNKGVRQTGLWRDGEFIGDAPAENAEQKPAPSATENPAEAVAKEIPGLAEGVSLFRGDIMVDDRKLGIELEVSLTTKLQPERPADKKIEGILRFFEGGAEGASRKLLGSVLLEELPRSAEERFRQRWALMNKPLIPNVYEIDLNRDNQLSRAEGGSLPFFDMADVDRNDVLTLGELQAALPRIQEEAKQGKYKVKLPPETVTEAGLYSKDVSSVMGWITMIIRIQDADGSKMEGFLFSGKAEGGQRTLNYTPGQEIPDTGEQLQKISYSLKRVDEVASTSVANTEIALDPADITGVYTGNYISNKMLMNLEFMVARDPLKGDLSGTFSFFPPGSSMEQAMGIYAVKGTLGAGSNIFQMKQERAIRTQIGATFQGLQGSFDPAKGELKGTLPGNPPGTFTATRDVARSTELQAKVNGTARAFEQGPIAIADARNDRDKILAYMRWLRRVEQEFPTMDTSHTPDNVVFGRAVNLYLDEVFVPVFGKPLEKMDKQDRKFHSNLYSKLVANNQELLESMGHPGYYDWLLRPLDMDAGALSYPEVVAKVAYRRVSRAQTAAELENLKTIPATEAGHLQIKELEGKTPDAEDSWPSDQLAFKRAIEDAKRRIAPPVIAARIDAALSQATDYDGVVKLQRALVDVPDLVNLMPPEILRAEQGRVNTAVEKVVVTLQEVERSKIDALGDGLESLERGAAWHHDFTRRFVMPFESPSIDATLAHFQKRRAADLEKHSTAAIAALQIEATADGVRRKVAAQAGLPTDHDSPAAQSIRQAGDERIVAIAWEKEKDKYSERELALMKRPGIVEVPADYPAPTSREVGLAVLRAIASTGGQVVSPQSATFTPMRMIKEFAYTMTINDVELGEAVKTRDGGYECTCRLFLKMQMPGAGGFDDSIQSQIYRNVAANMEKMMEETEPDWIVVKMVLTPQGWRSPSMEMGFKAGSLDFFLGK